MGGTATIGRADWPDDLTLPNRRCGLMAMPPSVRRAEVRERVGEPSGESTMLDSTSEELAGVTGGRLSRVTDRVMLGVAGML